MGKNKVKKPKPSKTRHTNYQTTQETSTNHLHPAFCFKYLHPDYDLDSCQTEEKVALARSIVKLSQTTWNEIMYSPRHGLGHETIKIDAIKARFPKSLPTPYDRIYLAFRFSGKKSSNRLQKRKNILCHMARCQFFCL